MSARRTFPAGALRCVGIDEAGLGPILGPFCAAAVRYDRAPRAASLPPAWKRAFEGSSRALLVADSKLVFRGPRGAARGEAAALAALCCGAPEGPLLGLDAAGALRRAGVEPAELAVGAPWYAEFASAIPRFSTQVELDAARAELEAGAASGGVRWVGASARCVPERAFNAALLRWQNKADAAWEGVGGLVAEALGDPEPERFEIRIDRQGGRRFYGERLEALLPAWTLNEAREVGGRSEYRLRERASGREARVILEPRAETASFAVALASLLAKYLRELAMDSFNAWFARLAPEVRPTAGYPEDGRRWIEEMSPALSLRKISVETLVRQR
ncbi:MAG: hypothetical protein JNM84_14840 [Planctomycetes bacterium]|nr:hypothetical protein [Planctomycetota bacterium]